MPNWTFNDLKVETTEWLYEDKKEKKEAEKQLDEFIESSVSEGKESEDKSSADLPRGDEKKPIERVFSFQGVVPMPKELKITSPAHTDEEKAQAEINLKKYGAKDWYDWCNLNWGTKWDACNSHISDEGRDEKWEEYFIRIAFDTAWCPPFEYLQKATEKYPLLRFTCQVEEESEAFLGNLICQWGKLVDNTVSIDFPERDKEGDE